MSLTSVPSTLAREIQADTTEMLNDTSPIKEDTVQILAEIARLQEQLPRDANQRSAGFMLERYLDNLTSYAETVCDPLLDGSDRSRPTPRAGSGGEAALGRDPSRPTGWKYKEPAFPETSIPMATPLPVERIRMKGDEESVHHEVLQAFEHKDFIPPDKAKGSPVMMQEHEHVQIPATFSTFAPEHGYTDVERSVIVERLERLSTSKYSDDGYGPPAPPTMAPQFHLLSF
jgi:hypothetical protein